MDPQTVVESGVPANIDVYNDVQSSLPAVSITQSVAITTNENNLATTAAISTETVPTTAITTTTITSATETTVSSTNQQLQVLTNQMINLQKTILEQSQLMGQFISLSQNQLTTTISVPEPILPNTSSDVVNDNVNNQNSPGLSRVDPTRARSSVGGRSNRNLFTSTPERLVEGTVTRQNNTVSFNPHNTFDITANNINQNLNMPVLSNVPVTTASISFSEPEVRTLLLNAQNRVPMIPIIEKPKFRDHTSRPKQFIKNFESYCLAHKINEHDKLTIIKSCFEGPAIDWVILQEDSWLSFEDFKKDFFNYFWSPEIQRMEKRRVLAMHYKADETLTMSQYFLRQVTLLRSFTPVLSDLDILNEVMRQFPIYIQSAWSVYFDRTMAGALSFIEKQAAIQTSFKRVVIPKEKTVSITKAPVERTKSKQIASLNIIPSRPNYTNVPPPSNYDKSTNESVNNVTNPSNEASSSGNDRRSV